MKKGEAMPGNYLGKEDFPQDTLVTIKRVVMEEIKSESGSAQNKPVMYFLGASNPELDLKRGMVVNSGNWDMIEEISGHDDSDKWNGVKVVVYVDPSVMFGNNRVGGLRIREAKQSRSAEEEPPPPVDDDVPF